MGPEENKWAIVKIPYILDWMVREVFLKSDIPDENQRI